MSVHIKGLSTEDTELLIAALRVTAGVAVHSQDLEERRRCGALADRILGGLQSERRRASMRRLRNIRSVA